MTLALASVGTLVAVAPAQAAGPCSRQASTGVYVRWYCGPSGGGEYRAYILCRNNNPNFPYTNYTRYGSWRAAGNTIGSETYCDSSSDSRLGDGPQTR
ncbi:MAG TPA: hypothetical protein VNV66_18030 [Pilimelia sp.]|nr:hypothetical protein [Pilimelia sp.]